MIKNHQPVISGVPLCCKAEDWGACTSSILHIRAQIQSM
jgi:hypothetical protein